MLRYRPTDIRLAAQDVDETTKRLHARRAAASRPPASLSTGPRLRRGPERSRDEAIVHGGDAHKSHSCAVTLAADTNLMGRRDCHSNPGGVDEVKRIPAQDELGFSAFTRPFPQYDGAAEARAYLLLDPAPSPRPWDGGRHRALKSPEAARPLQPALDRATVHGYVPYHPRAPRAASPAIEPRREYQASHGNGSASHRPTTEPAAAAEGSPVWFGCGETANSPRDSVIGDGFDMKHLSAMLDEDCLPAEEAIPSIRLPSPTSTRSSSDTDKRRYSLPTLPNLSHSPSVSQLSDHSSRNASRRPSSLFRNTSTPDLLRPLLGPPSAPSNGSKQTSRASSLDNSPTSSAAMLDLIRRDSSPLEQLEQETRSQISRAQPSIRGPPAHATSSRASAKAPGEHRMPTFESPERSSPRYHRATRYRNAPPTFAEIPLAMYSSTFDALPSQIGFGSSPPSGAFIDRYPSGIGARPQMPHGTSSPHQGASSMPSLQAPRATRRRASGQGPAYMARNTHMSNHPPWSRVAGADSVMGSRRNTLGGQQRLRRYRSISARLLPPWQDEQENSGRAERMAMMAEIQERRRYVEQTNDGRLDRTPPSLGTFERRIVEG